MQTGQLERGAVGHGRMHIAAPEDGRPVAGNRVQVGPSGQLAHPPANLVPAPADEPLARRCLIGPIGDALHHFGFISTAGQINQTAAQTPVAKMDVGVAQAGQQQTAAEIDHVRLLTGQRQNLAVSTNSDNVRPADGHGRRPGLIGINGVDTAVVQDKCGIKHCISRKVIKDCPG